jgi:large conductance mechanosensitive channel
LPSPPHVGRLLNGANGEEFQEVAGCSNLQRPRNPHAGLAFRIVRRTIPPRLALARPSRPPGKERDMFEEFRKFALRGSMVDLAVGIIIGAAFNGVVNSLVKDIIMPVIGLITGGLDFNNYFWQLAGKPAATYAEAQKAGAVIGYGTFITLAINFVIIAIILFFIIKGMNMLRARAEREEAPPAPAEEPPEVKLLTEIRDILAAPQRA